MQLRCEARIEWIVKRVARVGCFGVSDGMTYGRVGTNVLTATRIRLLVLNGAQKCSTMKSDILHISKVNVDVRQCAHCREASVLRSKWWAYDMIPTLLTMLTNESQGKFARSRYTNFSKRP